jgi:KUP system potassium uptake protein
MKAKPYFHWNGENGNPFYYHGRLVQPFGIIIATMAAVIASQALISGSLYANEAMRLNFLAKSQNQMPTEVQGPYPSINWLLLLVALGCTF